jgi:hypothetical protein
VGTVVDLNIIKPGYPNLAPLIAWSSAGWKTAVRVDGTVADRGDRDRGWTCEMAIPLSDLAPAYDQPRPGATWRVNFYRIDRPDRKDANKDIRFSAWSPTRRSYHEPDRFGFLTFAADPYGDDFSLDVPGKAPGAPWVVTGGQWEVAGVGVVGRDCIADGWTPVGLRGGLPDWTDYRLSADLEVTSVGGDWRDGPWFGVRCAGGDGYFIEFTGREVQVHKSCQGRSTGDADMVAHWPLALAPGPHHVAIEVRGREQATLAVTLDGQAIGAAADRGVLGVGPVPAGGIVLCARKWSGTVGHTVVRFSNVRVEPIGR